jgi:hypothetical protein
LGFRLGLRLRLGLHSEERGTRQQDGEGKTLDKTTRHESRDTRLTRQLKTQDKIRHKA